MRHCVTVCTLFVLSACGGGGVAAGTGGNAGTLDGGSSSGTDCPNLSGTWVVMAHCESTFIGMSTALTQTGCSYNESNNSYNCSGTITESGAITQACPIDETQTISCTGQFSEGTMTLSCSDDCGVVLELQ